MTGLERLKFKCACYHADGIIRMTRDQLRDIIEQIERETVTIEWHQGEEPCVTDRNGMKICRGDIVRGPGGIMLTVTGFDGGAPYVLCTAGEGDEVAVLPTLLVHEQPDTWDHLRGIIEQFGLEANHPVQAGPSNRVTFYDRLVLGWVEAHGGLDEIKKGQEMAESYKECLDGVCRRLGLTDGSDMPEMPEVIYSEIGRATQDSENRRAELCHSLGIDLETGWSDAMVEMRSRLMPEGHEWPRYGNREPVLVGDAVAIPLGSMIVEAVEFSKTGVTGQVLADLKDGKDGDWITSKRVQLGGTVCRARAVRLDSSEDTATGKPDGWKRLDDDCTLPPRTYYAKLIGHDAGIKSDEEISAAVLRHVASRAKTLALMGRDE